jgi:hypothetical protein
MRKQAFIAPLLCLVMLAGFASAGPTPIKDSYTAGVLLTGTIQLGWYNWTSKTFETYNLSSIEANFTTMVPTEIAPGTYNNASFQGYARVDENSVEFYGVIKVNATCPRFMVSFTVPNNWPNVPTAALEACGTVETTITETTLPSLQYTWVHVVGPVTQYGNETAMGWLDAKATITNVTQLAKVHVFWMPKPSFTPMNGSKPANFTYSFYHASLINTTIAAMNYTGYDFYVSGLWTVCNVTFTYYGQKFDHCKENVTVIKQNATGALEVSGIWKNFIVSISGFDHVKGLVTRMKQSEKRILDGDISGPNGQPDSTVNIYDLVAVAKHIGETPGLGQGSHDLQQVESYDLNFDFHIDVYTLVSVATDIGR